MIDPQELFLTKERIKELQAEKSARLAVKKAEKKPRPGIQFYQFPVDVINAIDRSNYAPVWRLVHAIYKTWFENRNRNPVKLTSARLAEFQISRGQKSRALKILEQIDQFGVERLEGRNPLVTMKWKPLKD